MDAGALQGFVRIRYFDDDIQMKVQGTKHVIKEQEVEVEFLQVCRIPNIIVCIGACMAQAYLGIAFVILNHAYSYHEDLIRRHMVTSILHM